MDIRFELKPDGLPCLQWWQFPGMFLNNAVMINNGIQHIKLSLERADTGQLYILRHHLSSSDDAGRTVHSRIDRFVEFFKPPTSRGGTIDDPISFWADDLRGFVIVSKGEIIESKPDPNFRRPTGSAAVVGARIVADLGLGRSAEIGKHFDFSNDDVAIVMLRAELHRVFIDQEWRNRPPVPPKNVVPANSHLDQGSQLAAVHPVRPNPAQQRPRPVEDDVI